MRENEGETSEREERGKKSPIFLCFLSLFLLIINAKRKLKETLFYYVF